MKKIMFSERFGLEQAVLAGTKAMTRRIIKGIYVAVIHLKYEGSFIGKTADGDSVILPQPAYRVGEEVAIAQRYSVLNEKRLIMDDSSFSLSRSNGWNNKMFVKAEYMPHRIRITGIKVERLQDISEEDAMREGVLKAPFDGYHVTGIGITVPKSMARPIGQTADGKPVYGDRYRDFKYDTPREAFAALIDRISGRGTWQGNPWVYAYTFELIK